MSQGLEMAPQTKMAQGTKTGKGGQAERETWTEQGAMKK
jgi:hypothetical protein